MKNVEELLREALSLHQSGRLDEAERIYGEILLRDQACAMAWYLSGMLATQAGKPAEGASKIENAVRLGIQSAEIFSHLGESYRRCQRLQEAATAFDRALKLNPNLPDALFGFGLLLNMAGRYPEALPLFQRLVTVRPSAADAYHQLGIALAGNGQHLEAISQFKHALRIQPNHYFAMKDLAVSLRSSGEVNQALNVLENLTKSAPGFLDGQAEFALALAESGQTDQAIEIANRLIPRAPNAPAPHILLGRIHAMAGHYDESIASLKTAIELKPNSLEALTGIGKVYEQAQNLDESVRWLERAFQISPNVRLGKAIFKSYLQLGRTKDALNVTERVLSFAPQDVETHCNRSMVLLALGDYVEGFKEYEWREKLETSIRVERKFRQPKLEANDPSGKTILIHTEQGFGDVIQFARYIPLLADRGATIILDVPSELQSLMETVPGVTRVIATGQALPDFDFHTSLMTLARLFKTSANSIPANVPYIFSSQLRIDRWKPAINAHAKGFKVGLVWAGNALPDPKRTCPVEKISALADVESVSWYSLQFGGRRDAGKLPERMEALDLSQDIFDFADTAAILNQLDLLITIDTATAHLAGAMGINAWVMIPFVADWRWFLGETSTPWYPTMRLFKQTALDDWESVIARIRSELTDRVKMST